MKERTQIWTQGDIAEVKQGWDRAGTIFTVLGPAVFLKQWWVPVDDVAEDDPDFFKEAALTLIEPKRDGRKAATGSAFPYRLSNAARDRLIVNFLTTGSSTHSSAGMCLGVLLEYCHKKQINFRLIKVNHGYFIRKV